MRTGLPRRIAERLRRPARRGVSPFRITPSEIVRPRSLDQILHLFAWATEHRGRLTFRGGGSSLSGQAESPHVIVDLSRSFRQIEVLDDGERVHAGAGATLAEVNSRLARHGRRLGPTMASATVATVGGLVATDAAGPAPAEGQQLRDTLEDVVVALPTGAILDTRQRNAEISLRLTDPHLVQGLLTLRHRLERPDTTAEVRRQFAIPNTMGYRVAALLDHDSPVEMAKHLIVGSEGTLGFVAEVTLRTVPLRPRPRPRDLEAPYTSLARRLPGHVLLEDFAVPATAIDETVAGLRGLLVKHSFTTEGITTTPDGCIRYALTVDLDDAATQRRFRRYRRDVVALIRAHGGSLRAHHGTGRAMSPFMLDQFGDELFEVMREVKHTFDPAMILGPGILLTDDPLTHTRDLRPGRSRSLLSRLGSRLGPRNGSPTS
ncbi:FAD-binding oxidoreductase [Arachnia propionica]|uniref:D-lactate dehydrogenase (cytochrome) n=1 Tax=Arachnia propionica TaxID=1750 RepID=A0A3P1WQX6_9ACTN|nr:FAD-binding oxidoreductase [Arachnia propionica]RRD48994.1 FAD-binding oxidoreductase [Arachnia propionica]